MNNLSIRKMTELSKKKKKGFTLIELIIVIAIIAILAAMAIPKLGSMRNSARVSNDVAAAKNIATVTSALVSDGTLSAGSYDVSASAGAAIKGKLDGKVGTTGKTEASNTAFIATVATDGGVTVTVGTSGGTQLYPDSDGTGRKTYAGNIS